MSRKEIILFHIIGLILGFILLYIGCYLLGFLQVIFEAMFTFNPYITTILVIIFLGSLFMKI